MHFDQLLLAGVIVLLACAVSVSLFKRLGLGSVLGFLAAGMIVGPWGLQVTDKADELRHIAELGVVLLLFVIGLEMRPAHLWDMRRWVLGLGSLQILVSGLFIGAYAWFVVAGWQAAVVVGLGLALSSTAFVLQIIGERGEMGTPHGRAGLGILLAQDVAIVPLLALVPLLAGGTAADSEPVWKTAALVVMALAGLVAAGRWVLPWALGQAARHRNMEAFAMLAFLSVTAAAWLMEVVGLSMALGAFVLGMTLSTCRYRFQTEAVVRPFKGFLLGLFFIAVGMSIDVGMLVTGWGLVALHLAVVLVIKIAVLFGLSMAFGLSRPTALRVAFLLPQCGEFGFVLFGAAVAAGIIDGAGFSFAILVISLTMVATPLLANLGDRLARRAEGAADTDAPPFAAAEMDADKHVVIAGYGRVGQVIALMLERAAIPYLAFDTDSKAVAKGRAAGHAVEFGDMTDPGVQAAAGVDRAAAVVVSFGGRHGVEQVVTALRNFHPDVPVHVRVHDLAERHAMHELGVADAVPETVESSLALGVAVLESVGAAADDLDTITRTLREDQYAALTGSEAPAGAD
ncbi:MAG: cation:proton antiporter [Rhodospirillales bacterium]|nr:cation:proton antiporter [Rhodospirillales bacterium]